MQMKREHSRRANLPFALDVTSSWMSLHFLAPMVYTSGVSC